MGAQVVWCIGNHDERAPYAKGLFGSDDDGPQDRVYDVGGLRIVALDTSVPKYHHGELVPEQLDWLRDVLSTPAEHGTILAMHHAPIPVPTLEPAAIIELLDQDRLAEVIAGSDVRQILGGHFHYTSHSTFAGVPVSIASASCYTTDPAPVDRLISGVDGHQAFNTVHVYDDRIVHTVIPDPGGARGERPAGGVQGGAGGAVVRGAPRDHQPQGLRLQHPYRVPRAAGTR